MLVGESDERDITVETRTVRAVFTNRGARLRHWVLKDYKNDDGQPLDLVPAAENVNNALTPFSLRLDDAALTSKANGGLYRSQSPASVDATTSPATVAFEWQDADGLPRHQVVHDGAGRLHRGRERAGERGASRC